MNPPEPLLKTRQVADALGVSVSSIKRWVDSGELRASRTVGRHRLIPASAALDLARKYELPLGRLRELMGSAAAPAAVLDDRFINTLAQALLGGRSHDVRQLIGAAQGAGADAALLGDRLIRPVMERVGHGWECGSVDVFQEHQASQILGSILVERIGQVRSERGVPGPLALGASPEGDLYSLSNLLCELLLRERGWEVINLGPNLPLKSLAKAAQTLQPRLVWLSVTHLADPSTFLRDYQPFYKAAVKTRAAVILGGQALGPELRAQLVATSFGDRLTHLAEFARQLHPQDAAGSDPKSMDRPARWTS